MSQAKRRWTTSDIWAIFFFLLLHLPCCYIVHFLAVNNLRYCVNYVALSLHVAVVIHAIYAFDVVFHQLRECRGILYCGYVPYLRLIIISVTYASSVPPTLLSRAWQQRVARQRTNMLSRTISVRCTYCHPRPLQYCLFSPLLESVWSEKPRCNCPSLLLW